jgi:molybdate transport system ATP-binding protein
MLAATLAKRLGGFSLAATLEVEPNATLVLVGESGAGKTTLLRLLAGLAEPDEGRIVLDGRVWLDRAAGVCLPSWRREVGYLAQDYALFPHLTVHGNVAFGLRAQGLDRRSVRQRVDATLGGLGLTSLADRRPDHLSGGQRQRVALARALVLEPRLLLLDEPLSALDLQTRRAVRAELKRTLAGLPCATVYVTHNPVEAIVFGDRIAVLEAGRITQVGAPDELLRRPRSPYVAEFMGVNLFQGTVGPRDESGLAPVRTPFGSVVAVDPGEPGDVLVALNPREVTLHLEPPAGSAQNVFRGRIVELVAEPPFGERIRVALDSTPPLVAEVTRHAVESLGLREGLEVYAAFKATGLVPYR